MSVVGFETIYEAPTRSGGHFYPPADNAYDLGSTALSWRNAHFETAIYATSVVGNWNPSAASTYSLGTNTLEWQGLFLGDDTGVFIGLNQDDVIYHRTSVLNADTALTGVIIGTPDTTALAANSLIISNITSDGDILIAVNDGGHSKQMIFMDGSTGVTHLGKPGTPGFATASGDVYIAGKLEVDGISYLEQIVMSGTNKTITGTAQIDSIIYGCAGTASGTIQGGTANGQNMRLLARLDDTGFVEVAKMTGAADPYFSMGGSQENKFYNSGVVTLGGVTTMGANLIVGTIDIDDDSGVVTLVDMGVTSSPADGTEESIGFAIDGNIIIKLYSEADSAGAVDTISVRTDYDLMFTSSVDSAAVADTVTLNGYEISAGHRALAIGCEEAVISEAVGASDRSLPVRINGSTYKLMLHT